MSASTTVDSDLRNKINTFIAKLDKMEERVKEVEAITTTVPKLEAKLSKVASQVERIESHGDSQAGLKEGGGAPAHKSPSLVKAFLGGIAIGLIVIATIVGIMMLGLL